MKHDPEPVILSRGKVVGDERLWRDMLAEITPEDDYRMRLDTAISCCRRYGWTPEETAPMYGVKAEDVRTRL